MYHNENPYFSAENNSGLRKVIACKAKQKYHTPDLKCF